MTQRLYYLALQAPNQPNIQGNLFDSYDAAHKAAVEVMREMPLVVSIQIMSQAIPVAESMLYRTGTGDFVSVALRREAQQPERGPDEGLPPA